MVDFVCVSTRSLKVKFKLEKVKICVVATYDPSEGNVEKSTIFWDNLNDFLDGGIGDSVHLPHICPFKDFIFTVVTTTHGQSPIQGGGVLLSKVHPLAQITHMSTDAGFKVRRLNSVGNTEDGREFHKTEVVGKKKALQQTSLELPMSIQYSCADTAPIVLRRRRKGGGTRVISSLEHLPLRYL